MMIRREAKESFTWVHNTFIRDKRLSLAERGMLLLLISLSDWETGILLNVWNTGYITKIWRCRR